MTNIIKDMLLIEEPSIFKLYKEIMLISSYFVAPLFIIALVIEYFAEMNFPSVIKKLFIIIIFMNSFHAIHTKAVDLSLKTASHTLKKISPRSIFLKKWYHVKAKTKEKKGWNLLQRIAIPNLNDLLSTAFYLLSKVCIWFLKLIYSSVYHFTYVFCGVSALLYFFGWTNKSIVGTVQSSLWCIVLPFVVVAILCLVGNTIDVKLVSSQLAISDIETIIWLFGVTLLLLISPLITLGMVRGDGIAFSGAQMGSLAVKGMMNIGKSVPMIISSLINIKNSAAVRTIKGAKSTVQNAFRKFSNNPSGLHNNNSKSNSSRATNVNNKTVNGAKEHSKTQEKHSWSNVHKDNTNKIKALKEDRFNNQKTFQKSSSLKTKKASNNLKETRMSTKSKEPHRTKKITPIRGRK